jgi:hypothetical protein
MSTISDLSSGPLLCYCGFSKRISNSWTTSNPGKKYVLTTR